jgi:hypothetical protein
MPIFLNPRFAMLLLVGLPLAGGVAVQPQAASAFLLGAWAGVIFAAPAIYAALWVLGIMTIGQVLRPLMRLPFLLGLTVLGLYMSGVDLGFGAHAMGAGAALWWVRRGGRMI